MIRKLLPLLLAFAGLAVGVGAGLFLRPPAHEAEAVAEGSSDPHATETAGADAHGEAEAHGETDAKAAPEYVKLNNQFVVPVLEDGKVVSMVVLALSLEVTEGGSEQVYAREPKLRDAILQVLFDHANSGGFAGAFTDGSNLILLRKSLLEVAQKTLGPVVVDVLISDIARQDS